MTVQTRNIVRFPGKPSRRADPLLRRHGPHPVDRMAALKTQIAAFKAEYDDLRQQVIDGKIARSGDAWTAVVDCRPRRHIALRDAERRLAADVFDELVTVSESVYVTLVKQE